MSSRWWHKEEQAPPTLADGPQAPLEEAVGVKPSRMYSKSLDLSIVFGTFNRLSHLTRCINSLRKCVGNLSYEIVVCDAGSTDGSRERLASQEDVVLLAEHKREGAVKAFNKGYAVSRGQAIAFMNDDIVAVDESGFERAVEILRRPGVGQVAFAYNHRSERSFSVQSVHGKTYANLGIVARDIAERVIMITGGLWSPCYHTYGADTELSCWIHKLGLQVVPAHKVRFTDQHAEDDLRAQNQEHGRSDNKIFWGRWPNAGMLDPNGIDPKVTVAELSGLRAARKMMAKSSSRTAPPQT
jgi:glycosyltransferase involved in cell wall biosynthesis